MIKKAVSFVFRMSSWLMLLGLLLNNSLAFLPNSSVQASATVSPIRYLSGFETNVLPANDDGSSSAIPIGFTVNFFGNEHTQVYVNNNGNLTFDYPQATYTPYDLTSTQSEIIAAFFADVDTRGSGSSIVTYGNDTVDGHPAFGVNYVNVGYFAYHTDKLNSFQIILIDRSDIAIGDFDIEFNYEKIQWETGDYSGGSGGLGGYSARVGFSNGTREPNTFFELPGSSVNGAFLDNNPVTGLIYNSFNSGVTGRYHFEARNGDIATDHNPLILLPGIGGSKLKNDHNQDGTYDEVWPNAVQLYIDPWDGFLRVTKLKLKDNSADTEPYEPYNPAYFTVRVGDIMRGVPTQDFYDSTVRFFTEQRGYQEGVDFFVCPYDWRKHIPDISNGALSETLDKCVNEALALNPTKTQVDILAHSMGGLVARAYLTDPVRAAKVEHLVTLGTPYLGAPKIALATIDKLSFVPQLNSDMLRELAQNFPSVYEIVPGPQYFQVYGGYIYRDWDKNRDGQVDGWLSLDASYELLSTRNSVLSAQARDYYNSVGGWNNNGGTHGVQVLMVVGSGLASPTVLWEKQETDWWGNKHIKYTVVTGSGDDTVPQNSANMRNPNMGVDLSAGVSTVYFKLSHGDLPKNTQVLQVVATFFEGSTNLAHLQNVSVPQQIQDDGPRLEPIPLTGQYLTFDGQVTVEIIDEFGNRIGMLDEGGAYEVNIPNASFFPAEQITSVFLPDDRTYQIFVNGQDHTEVLAHVQTYTADEVSQTIVYDPLQMNQNSVAYLSFTPNAPPQSFALDQDGDGVTEQQVEVIAVLNSEQPLDTIAPQTTIDIQGTPDGRGWYTGQITVTISAEDNSGGQGVARIDYSVDGGRTIVEYSQPFTLDADVYHKIIARAIDFAGNRAGTFAKVGLDFIYLPLLSR